VHARRRLTLGQGGPIGGSRVGAGRLAHPTAAVQSPTVAGMICSRKGHAPTVPISRSPLVRTLFEKPRAPVCGCA
jgi:hypothetical protein